MIEPMEDEDNEEEAVQSASTSSRFAVMDEDGLSRFIEGQKNINTSRKTHAHMRVLRSYLETRGETRQPHTIPPAELDNFLKLFFVNVRKEETDNGDDEYEPSTIKGYQSSFERYLKENHYSESLITSRYFFESREAIKSKCRELKKKGKGSRPKRKRAPTQTEVNQMWDTGALGVDSPRSLQHTMWWVVNTRFGNRVNTENASMCWGDIDSSETSDGKKYLTYRERETKTRQGDDIKNVKNTFRVFADVEEQQFCPVKVYEEYKRRRPEAARDTKSR